MGAVASSHSVAPASSVGLTDAAFVASHPPDLASTAANNAEADYGRTLSGRNFDHNDASRDAVVNDEGAAGDESAATTAALPTTSPPGSTATTNLTMNVEQKQQHHRQEPKTGQLEPQLSPSQYPQQPSQNLLPQQLVALSSSNTPTAKNLQAQLPKDINNIRKLLNLREDKQQVVGQGR